MDLIDLISEPWSHDFMERAFLVAMMSGIVCGIVGSFVVLRGMAFIGDTVAHSVFPGVAVAYATGFNLALGGAIAGITTAFVVAVVSQNRRIKEDAIMGVFFAFAFALGILIVSTQTNYTGDLASFLFGQILGISDADVRTVGVLGATLVAVTLLVRKELVAVSLDRETAIASGLPAFWLDVLLYVMVTVAVVISLQAVGNILVLALLITPAATARMLTDRLGLMMLVAAFIGGAGSLLGLYLSYHYNLASGGLVVVVLTAVFAVCWLFAPRHGVVMKLRSARRQRLDAPRASVNPT